MSELRELALGLQRALTIRDIEWQCCLDEGTGSIEIIVQHLEAFAKAEQIKGMEAVKQILQAHPARIWLIEQIDTEIAKLKEGG